MIRPAARGARRKSMLNTQAWGENVLVELDADSLETFDVEPPGAKG
jgi:hypothetical protein